MNGSKLSWHSVCLGLVFALSSISPPAVIAGDKPTYNPPNLGIPTRRVGGGTRGAATQPPKLAVLATEYTGPTISARPALYWWVSKPVNVPVEFMVTEASPQDPELVMPLLEMQIASARAGIHALPPVNSLKTDVEYEWSVALVMDEKQRSQDIIASGTIKRIKFSANLSRRIKGAAKRKLPHIYAEAGLWYDAIAALFELIAENPDDSSLKETRAYLFEREGLKQVAAFSSK
ncbi:MAG: DUF928 domain-containing protein [Gammaproteobacteria bacterium]|nr:DUF928 domain-containing protein [Gammaproteobacteria bacterium]